MDSLLFITLYLCVLAAALIIYQKSGYSMSRPSIPMVLFWSFLVFGYIGYPLLYFCLVRYAQENNYEQGIVMNIWFLGSLSLICLVAGFYYSAKVLHLNSDKAAGSALKRGTGKYPLISALVLAGLCGVVLYLYLKALPSIPFIEFIMDDGISSATGVNTARSDMIREFQGKYHRYAFFFLTVLPFISYYLLAVYRIERKRLTLYLFAVVAAAASFGMLASLQKSLFIFYLAGIYLTIVTVGGKDVRVKAVLVFAGVSFAILTLMFYFYVQMFGRPLKEIIMLPVERIFAGQLAPQYYYYLYFPSVREYLHGLSFPNPMGFLPWIPVDYTVEVVRFASSTDSETASMPTTFWGEAFANFGVWGVAAVSFVVGVYVCVVDRVVKCTKVKPIYVALYAWCMTHYMLLSITGFSRLLFDVELMLVLVSSFIILLPYRIRSALTAYSVEVNHASVRVSAYEK